MNNVEFILKGLLLFVIGIIAGYLSMSCDKYPNNIRWLFQILLVIVEFTGLLIGLVCVAAGIIGLCAGVMV